MIKTKYAIIGAGPTGLGAAHRLKELGIDDFIVFEQAGYVGGLAASFIDDAGFTWDIGGHVQFSHYNYFDDVMLKTLGENGWLHHQRESWVWIENNFVPYPFQNNIRHLSKPIMWQCLEGIIDSNEKPNKKPANFHEWILATFGHGIANVFMLPYNFKVWAYSPIKLSYKWIGERVAVTNLKKVIKNIVFNEDDISWGPNNTFQFPKTGGTGAIWKAVAKKIGMDNILLNQEVITIKEDEKKLITADGTEINYEYILSTIPVDKLTDKVDTISPKIKEIANQLLYSSSHIIGIGLKGKPKEELKTKCWMYFPENNCPFYRVTVFSNYSPNNVPDINNNWSLMAEVSESLEKLVVSDTIIEETIKGLLATKLISAEDIIVSKWHYKVNHGYPTPSLNRDNILSQILPELEKHNIFSRGRFGGWKYEVSNQDHSFMQGVEWVNYIEQGIDEITYFSPSIVNKNVTKR